MAKKLSHLIPTLPDVKDSAKKKLKAITEVLERPALFLGQVSRYQPYSAAGEIAGVLELKEDKVQYRVRDLLGKLVETQSELLNTQFNVDVANQKATASVVVDGKVLFKDVPVTNLMFLHTWFKELRDILSKIPTPNNAIDWVYDAALGFLRSAGEVKTQRTQKQLRNHEMSPATDRHPAQVQTFSIDVAVGETLRREFSGAMPADKRESMLVRMDKLILAIKEARETANMQTPIEPMDIAAPLLRFVLDDTSTPTVMAQAA